MLLSASCYQSFVISPIVNSDLKYTIRYLLCEVQSVSGVSSNAVEKFRLYVVVNSWWTMFNLYYVRHLFILCMPFLTLDLFV